MSKKVLIFGGDKDFNVLRFLKRISSTTDAQIIPCMFGSSGDPVFTYDLQEEKLYIDKKEVKVDSVFLRYDVFNYLEKKDENARFKSQAFYTAFLGWLNSQKDVKALNKNYFSATRTNKVRSLILAKEAGFKISETYVSNDLVMLDEKLDSKKYIYKELEGGVHTEELSKDKIDLEQKSIGDYPFFMQEMLVQPEIRVFRVADEYFAFKMLTDSLDYRVNQDVRLEPTEVPDDLKLKAQKVTDALNLNFSAIDLKTHEESGELMFLEANSQPMFGAFDEKVDFAITDAMINYLTS